MAKAKSPKQSPGLEFAGAELRSWTGKVEEGGPVHRIKFMCTLTYLTATHLGCADMFYDDVGMMRATKDNRTTSGVLSASRIRLKADNIPAVIAVDVIKAEYEVHQVQAKEEGGNPDAHVALAVWINSSMSSVEAYAAIAGTAPGVLRVTLKGDNQPRLDEDVDSVPRDESEGDAFGAPVH